MTITAPFATTTAGQSVQGRVALVTGGTRGIGAAISRSLAGAGATVAAAYAGNARRASDFLDECRTEFGTENERVTAHQSDVSSADECRRLVADVVERHGRIDILVNNAGITIDRTVARMTDDDWQQVLDVNLSGPFYLAQAALGRMVEQGSGRIVMISSVIGETGNIGQANYAATKSGLFGLTKTLAREAAFQLAKSGHQDPYGPGITVNAVTPGFIATDMLEHIPAKVLDRIVGQVPLGRLGRPEEVARLVRFLTDDASAYITGQVWGVNGGLDM
ncbi:3-oxoacyl-ACP reductase FabG [Streptomyces sp. TP-A0356]|uniref:3-oxoacyl-ACP reductase FabG n=1 Tax=Streptomyces sp. TP-A0356 TaxID=1359208 RepID=UPI0006E1202F|nr:3-oxoacyl-ACP reductase FabG [Streptomyces sp. TP-A0356]